MVPRKPLRQNAALDPQAEARMQGGRQPSSSQDAWRAGGQQPQQSTRLSSDPDSLPASLRTGPTTTSTSFEDDDPWGGPRYRPNPIFDRVPTVLRPGSGGPKPPSPSSLQGAPPVRGNENDVSRVPTVLRPGAGKSQTNPFKRTMEVPQSELTYPTAAVSQLSLADSNVSEVPIAAVSQLSLAESDSSRNPWEPVVNIENPRPNPMPLPTKGHERELGRDVWDSARPSGRATPAATSHSPVLVPMPSDEGSAAWDEVQPPKITPPAKIPTPNQEVLEDAHAWDDVGNVDKGKAPAPLSVRSVTSNGGDEWNLIDIEGAPEPPPKPSTAGKVVETTQGSPKGKSVALERAGEGVAPELPPRNSAEGPPQQPPRQPPRPVDEKETYQIKNINWFDSSAPRNPRISPILVQNANGPCPLVALVNALSLTTPPSMNTALTKTLRSREQVSLGLLLDLVIDELISESRAIPGGSLPDISELYEFLKCLHTGMNVNPRFVPTPDVITAFKRTSLTHLHPTERGDVMPGTFEDTKEMALYSTFSIPLIHGWIPARNDPVYDSFSRQASSYEDVQNLLFREEELEDKLNNPTAVGLTVEEQQIYQDILTIKSFLSMSATQLTKAGLDVIRKSMRPGSFAILFRNDHFSTLYRHPQTGELLTLVTDAGYASHPEVVWESLVDVNGERAEFFSGDFRVVGGASQNENQHRRSGSNGSQSRGTSNGGWMEATERRGRNSMSDRAGPSQPPHPPNTEQEDRDLALALQLQEEEHERHRTEQDRRRRESLLSEQYIEQQGVTAAGRGSPARGQGAAVAPRGRGGDRGGSHQRVPSGRGGGSQSSLLNPQNAPALPARRSSGAVSIPVITTTHASGRGGPVRPPGQTVRSMIPPAAPRNPEDGVDDAPPTYEQAAGTRPFEPPAGHPSHPQSAPSIASTSGSVPSTPARAPLTPQVSPGLPSPMVHRPGVPAGPYPGQFSAQQQQRLRPGVPPQQMAGGGSRERECAVM